MIKLIAAVSKNLQIGKNNELPWHISEDLKYFRKTTSGQAVLMGRKTFESIGRPLPNRRNIVLTRNTNFSADGVEVVHTIEEAIALCKSLDQVFIIGGGQIYAAFLPYADELYLTLVDKEIDGDTDFPIFESQFECIKSTPGETTTEDGYHFAFTVWKRKQLTVSSYYDYLIEQGNDPVHDPEKLKAYMDKWDGQEFISKMNLNTHKNTVKL